MGPDLHGEKRQPFEILFHFAIWLSVFTPGHLLNWNVERAYTATIIVFCLVLISRKGSLVFGQGLSPKAIFTFFAILQFIFTLSYVNALVGTTGDTGLRDYFEITRFVCYFFFVFLIVGSYRQNTEPFLNKVIVASIAYSVTASFFYMVDVPFISSFLQDVVYADTSTNLSQLASAGRIRFSTPFANPNYLAYFLCLTLVYLLFFAKSSVRLPSIFGALYLLFLTGSRTGWFALVSVLGIWFLASLVAATKNQKGPRRVSLLLLNAAVAGAVFFVFKRFAQSSRIREVTSALAEGDLVLVTSLADRIQHNQMIWGHLQQSLALGLGPAKYAVTDVVDNQILLWLLQGGIFGASVILIGIAAHIYRLFRLSKGDSFARFGILALLSCLGIYMMTGAFLSNFRLFFLTVLIYVAITTCIRNDANCMDK